MLKRVFSITLTKI